MHKVVVLGVKPVTDASGRRTSLHGMPAVSDRLQLSSKQSQDMAVPTSYLSWSHDPERQT